MDYTKLKIERIEELLSLNIDILEHSQKTLNHREASPSLKALMKAQIERLLAEIYEMQSFFSSEALIKKGLLLKSQKTSTTKNEN